MPRRTCWRPDDNSAPAFALQDADLAMYRVMRVEEPQPILFEHLGQFLSGPSEFILDSFNAGLLRRAQPREVALDAYVRTEDYLYFLERTEKIADESGAGGVGHRPQCVETFEKGAAA